MPDLPPPLSGPEDLPDIVGRALRAAVPPLHTLVSYYPDLTHKHAGAWKDAVAGGFFKWTGSHTDGGHRARDHGHDPSILLRWIRDTWKDGPWHKRFGSDAGLDQVRRAIDLRNQHAHNGYDRPDGPLDAGNVRDGLMALEEILRAIDAEHERAYVEHLFMEAAKRADQMTKRKQWKALKRDAPAGAPHTVGLHWTEPNPETLMPERWWLIHLDPQGDIQGPTHSLSTDDALRYLDGFVRDDKPALVGCAFCFSVPWWLASDQASTPDKPAFQAVWDVCDEATMTVQSTGELIAALNRGFGMEEGPFWRGDVNEPDPNGTAGRATMRRTEEQVAQQTEAQPSSVFQIGGDASVGALAVHGMPLLSLLRCSGYQIWPFGEPERRTVVEIFPRSLWASTQYESPVHSRPADRERFVESRGYGRGGRN